MLSVNLLEMHRNLAQLLKRLSGEHHFFTAAYAVEELLHHIHVIDYECVKSLEIASRIQLRNEINFERGIIDRLAAFGVLIYLVATAK